MKSTVESNDKTGFFGYSDAVSNVFGDNMAGSIHTDIEQNVSPTIPEDDDSVKGHFGWTTVASRNIPYLQRSGVKLVSWRIIRREQHIFSNYTKLFTNQVFSCYRLPSVKATMAETNLLQEINCNHCDFYYGVNPFVVGETLVFLDDVLELEKFFHYCYLKLIKKDTSTHPHGFVKLSSETCVPFVLHSDKKYVPLFYLEGDSEYLQERAIHLKGWSLSYLKLACKLQGIREELYNKDTLQVVDLETVKLCFPPDTQFQELWLSDIRTDHLIAQPHEQSSPKEQKNQANRKYIKKQSSTPSYQSSYMQHISNNQMGHHINRNYISDRIRDMYNAFSYNDVNNYLTNLNTQQGIENVVQTGAVWQVPSTLNY